jgi:hypothetical protein
VAIHRWDAEDAVAADGGPPPRPLDGDVAAAGVEEFITEFLPGLLSQEAVEGLGGTLHLQAEDQSMDWWIDLNNGATSAREHAKADTAIRGTRSELLLWLTNRCPPAPWTSLATGRTLTSGHSSAAEHTCPSPTAYRTEVDKQGLCR